ncbi:MAG: family 10 glycosylhydrolase [Armatimonadota bacterium]|nr:family 10 glycosylhydrolase [Armatimonadota bacterium]
MNGPGWRPSGVVFALGCLLVLATAWQADARAPARLPRRALWMETSANLRTLSSREAIRAVVARARAAGIDTLIPEAKNAWGFVIYESDIAPHIRTLPVPLAGTPAPSTWYPQAFDALAVLIEEAHAAGLQVHAAVNVFGEGLVVTPGVRLVGTLERHPEWMSVHVRAGADGRAAFVPSFAAGPIAFANPAHPEAQLYELAVLWEVVSRYHVDGIVLDRARYAGLDSDFSALSRAQFEAFTGRPVAGWPDDIIRLKDRGLRPGPRFSEWVAWRASVIRAYVRAASRLVRRVRPGLPVAMYVGAWYPVAFEVGQNWARPDAPPLFEAWSPAWSQASLLPDLDYLIVGLYYRTVTRWEALQRRQPLWRSVVGGAVLSRDLTEGTPLLGGIWFALHRGNRAAGEGAVRAAMRIADGLMAFDLSDVQVGDWWGVLGVR